MLFTVEYVDSLVTVDAENIDYWGGGCGYADEFAHCERALYRQLMNAAKQAVGLNGVRGRAQYYGDVIEFRPFRTAAVMLVYPAT